MIYETLKKILIFTNPLTYILLIFAGFLLIIKWIYKKSQVSNLYYYHFKLKKQNEFELKIIDKWCKKRLEKKLNKWESYVITLNQKRTIELLKGLNK